MDSVDKLAAAIIKAMERMIAAKEPPTADSADKPVSDDSVMVIGRKI